MILATVHPQPSAYAERSGAVYLGAAAAAELGLDGFVRITTRRGRTVLGRISGALQGEPGAVIQFDRFARQALKAFPHEQVTVERADLVRATQVILTPAIDVPVGNMQQVISGVKAALAEQQAPVREGMLLYVKLSDGLAGITYDVHGVSGGEGFIADQTAVYLSFGNDHDHPDETG